jgi:hypothetical protein
MDTKIAAKAFLFNTGERFATTVSSVEIGRHGNGEETQV